MSYRQLKEPNYDPVIYQDGKILTNWLGYCLAYVQFAYNVGWAGATAFDAWTRTPSKHTDYNIPAGVAVPIYFNHWGDYGYGYQNYGHIAIYKDGKIYSSPLSRKYTADVFWSIQEVEQKYNSKYIGWSEYVGPHAVLEAVQQSRTARVAAVKCYARNTPDTSQGPFQDIDAGASVEMKGFVTNGQAINGNTTWFVTALSGKYMSAECFTDKLTHDLPDLTPAAAPPAPTQRKAVAEGANIRRVPNTTSEVSRITAPGELVEMQGWTTGEEVNGSNRWFILKSEEKLYSHTSAYENTSVEGLEEVRTEQPEEQEKIFDPSQFIVDVSSFQDDSVANILPKFAGVILRAGHVGPSHGGLANEIDPKMEKFARAAGDKLLGLYWLPYFDKEDPNYSPEKEAERFIAADKLVDAPLLFVDLEPSFDGTIEQLLTFKNAVYKATGKAVLTYAGNAIIQKLNLKQVDWYPNYSAYKSYDHGNALHQFTDKARIDGYNGNLDLSTTNIGVDELKKKFAKKPLPEAPAKPENPKDLPENKTVPTKELTVLEMIKIFFVRLITAIIKKLKGDK